MKKIIAVILSLTIALTVGMPAFAFEEETLTPDITQEEITDPSDSEEGDENADIPEVGEDDPLTDEEIEEIRKEKALSAFDGVRESATESLIGILMIPFIPVMLIIPFFGWVTTGAALMSPIVLITLPVQFIIACVEAVEIYNNFDASEYQAIFA